MKPAEHIEEAHKGLGKISKFVVLWALLHAVLAIAEIVLEMWRNQRHGR